MRNDYRLVSFFFTVFLFTLSLGAPAWADNNIEFLNKDLIGALNFGIYEVVTPKKENEQITYARELPFATLDFVERTDDYYSIGTAFFINEQELMTAAHVFGLEFFSLLQDFYIRDAEGRVYPVSQVRRYSTLRDMVVFDLTKYPTKIRPLDFSTAVAIGDTVFSVGNAQGEGIAYRAGQVASFTPEREYGKWQDIRFTSPASPGNSGGPLLNIRGEVVGLIVKKNQSENYNISVPIGELDKLTDLAEFHIRNLASGLVGVDDMVTGDWSFSMQLPATIATVAGQAQNSLDQYMADLGDKLLEMVREKNYPEGERFRSYLRNQPKIKGLAILLPENNFKLWTARRSYQQKIPLSPSQNVYQGTGLDSDLLVIVEKPEELSLKTFIDSPETVMDNLLKGVSITRTVGREKVPITSLGKPVRSELLTDPLGRTWRSSLWELHHSDSFMHTSCLPYPRGVICRVDRRGSAYRKYGYFRDVFDSYDEFIVGYTGEIADWQHYFALGKTYLPTFFQKVNLEFSSHRLQLNLDGLAVDFTNNKITEQSTLHFHLGYSNSELLAEDLVLFEIYPEKGARSHYRIQPFFEPDAYSSDTYRATWHDVIAGTGEYSGENIVKGQQRRIAKAIAETSETLATYNDRELATIIVAGCSYKTTDGAVDKDCSDFLQSITVTGPTPP